MNTIPVCSIVIRAYNEEKHLPRLIDGIKRQNLQDIEIILVDSGSTDRTVAIAQENDLKIVHIDPADFTFGRSLNQGIQAARAEYVVFASAHVYPVYPDWLEQLLSPFNDERVALSYGKQRGNSSSKYSEQRIFSQWFPETSHLNQTHPFCNNANAAIRKSTWLDYPYDEALPGLEDLDWANRIQLSGKQIVYVSEAEIIHVHNETPKGVFNRYLREGMAFKKIFPQEKFNLSDFFRLSTENIIHDLKAARQEEVSSGVWSEIIWFRVMQFWGTYRGYHQSGPLTMHLRERFYYPNRHLGVGTKKNRLVEPIQYNE